MSGVKVSCPACGASIGFPVGSAIVAVCAYCRSVVARSDRRLEDLGKVAALVETDSVLEVGRKGRYEGVPYTLTGRTQMAHPAGGVWDEWYAAFADDRWGWLAEAQGRFYLTFEKKVPAQELPAFDDLEVGGRIGFRHGPAELTVAEKSHAKPVSAEGAMPYRLTPDVTYYYADLSGPTGEFATLDYEDAPPHFFLGREVTLDDLGVPNTVKASERAARQVAGLHLNCPQCAGALELRAPDKSERVVCPSCGALLDVHQGQLRYLETLKAGKVRPSLPLGSVGKLKGDDFMTIGFMRRSVRVEGTRYYWEEYLLYHIRLGFRWLVCSDSHWSFVEPLPPGTVHLSGRSAVYKDTLFQIFQQATAVVENVQGEFYWKVTAGEEVQATDYIRPPLMLSREVTKLEGEGEGEINWSLGTYLPVPDVEKAFGLKTPLPRPAFTSVAPNQPFLHKRIYYYWGLLAAASAVLLLFFLATERPRKVFDQTFQAEPVNDPEKPQVIFTDPFQLNARQNVRVTVRAELDNAWLDVEGDLIQEDTDLVQPFSAPVEYYHGVEDGESWQEGSKETTTHLSALPAGAYRMRLEFVAGRAAPASPQPLPTGKVQVHVLVEQGVVRIWPWLLTVALLSVIPALVIAYHIYFERRRWEESSFSPFHTYIVKRKGEGRRAEVVSD